MTDDKTNYSGRIGNNVKDDVVVYVTVVSRVLPSVI